MTARIRPWLSLMSACLAIPLILAMTPAAARTASAARIGRAAHSHAGMAASKSRCKKQNKASGTVKYSDWQFPDNLNPFQTNSATSILTLDGILDTMVFFDQNARVRPQLLAQLPTIKNGGITNGGKTINLVLKKGVLFSNGKELTAADVKFSWQVSMDKATGPACLGSCDNIARIDTVGSYRLILHMKAIYAALIDNGLTFNIFPRVWPGAWNNDPHAAALKLGQDPTFNFESPSYPTNGAFQVTQWVTNDRIVLSPMKYYSDMNCGAYVKTMIFVWYANKPAMIAAAAAKQTDITGGGGGYTEADLPELNKHTGSYRLSVIPSFTMEHLEFNLDSTYNGKPNPVADTKVRQALALALDKQGDIRSSLGENAAQARKVIAWTPWINTATLVQQFADKKITGQWDPISKKYVQPGTAQAVADAKKLLASTPYKDGFSLDLFTTSGNPVRQASVAVITANWAKLGVKVIAQFVPGPQKLFAQWDQGGILHHGAFQVAEFGFTGSPEPDTFQPEIVGKYCDRRAATHGAINNNDACIADPLIDNAMNAAAHTFDARKRAGNYAAVQIELNKQSYWIMLYYRTQISTATRKVLNWYNNPTSEGPTWNMFALKVGAAS